MADALSLTKDVKKQHRVRKSGAKANKKANKDGKVTCFFDSFCDDLFVSVPVIDRLCTFSR